MKTQGRKTAQFGELVVVAFDNAAQYSKDPEEVSRLATSAVFSILRHAPKMPAPATRLLPLERRSATP